MKCQVNLKLLPIKAHFLLLSSAASSMTPFLPIIGRDLGFSSTVVGGTLTISTIIRMFSKIFLNGLADRYQIKKQLFIFMLIILSFAFIPLNFLPSLPMKNQIRARCENEKLQFESISKISNDVYEKIQETNETGSCQVSCPMGDDWIKLGTTSRSKSIFRITTTINPKNASTKDNIMYFPIDQVVVNGTNMVAKCKVKDLSMVCDVVCSSEPVGRLLKVRKEYTFGDVVEYYQFWVYLLSMMVGWIAFGVVMTLGDAICFEMLDHRPDLYGKQRVWTAVGRGVFSIVGGYMIDESSNDPQHSNYISVMILMSFLLIADIIVATFFQTSKQNRSRTIRKDIGKLLSQVEIVFFLFWCMMVGIFISLLWNSLFWRIEEMAETYPEFHIKRKLLEGLVMAVRGFGGDFPFFYISGWIINHLGHMYCITLVFFTYSVRFFVYSIMINPWWLIPIECLNGITFALFFTTMISYANKITPPGAEATTQGLVTSMTDGIGIAIGFQVTGWILDGYGSTRLFQIFSGLALLCCILQFLEQQIRLKHRRDLMMSNNNINR